MTTYFLASSRRTPPPPPRKPREPIPKLSLESMDGTKVIHLDDTMGWIRMPGAIGLEMAPTQVVRKSIPGVAGSTVADVLVLERSVFLPLYGYASGGFSGLQRLLDELRALVDPTKGSFKLVGASARGVRELIVTYDGGLEGADDQLSQGLYWCKIGLRLTAEEPFARAREEERLEFRVAEAQTAFMGVVGGTDAPWPGSMADSAVIGTGMRIPVYSEVPVFPKLELVGPVDSLTSSMALEGSTDDDSWSVDIPPGVPAGSHFVMVTDPRRRSVRMNGNLAGGRVKLGSAVYPLQPGMNILDVVAPGGTGDTLIALSWRNLFWSLW